MLLLGSFGDGSMYVSFIIERGTWRFACVVMIDVVVELKDADDADCHSLFHPLLSCHMNLSASTRVLIFVHGVRLIIIRAEEYSCNLVVQSFVTDAPSVVILPLVARTTCI